MVFNKESDFEAALIARLIKDCGWDKDVLKYKTEEELIEKITNVDWSKVAGEIEGIRFDFSV